MYIVTNESEKRDKNSKYKVILNETSDVTTQNPLKFGRFIVTL